MPAFLLASKVEAATLSEKLAGRILLQVEAQGQAYYVNPLDLKKYYLGRPADAFQLMRSFGLGVSDYDLNKFLKNETRNNLAGRILLQVEAQGQAYYVNPLDLKLYYLGRPADAFNLMRKFGLGITNYNLSQISSGNIIINNNTATTTNSTTNPISVQGEKIIKFTWKYNNKNYYLFQTFYDSWYNDYKNSIKYLSYSSDNPPNNIRESYYNIFLTLKNDDDSITKLIRDLKRVADIDGLSDTEFLEFVMAFVQYIPYDKTKTENSPQNFPYETLYLNSGICSDKTFLALLILRNMGYGGAIFDFPDKKHSAVAVACSGQSSYDFGYCFIETTSYFPIGIFPGNIDSGQASSTIDWSNILGQSSWGNLEVYQKTTGKEYTGMSNNINIINEIKELQRVVQKDKDQLDLMYLQITNLSSELKNLLSEVNKYKAENDTYNYGLKVTEYNTKVKDYNELLNTYYSKVDIYNNNISKLNNMINDFWQIS